MTDTLFADVSYYQRVIDDTYPYPFVSFRSNDGTFRDPNFDANLERTVDLVRRGKLLGFLVYFVFRENTAATLATLESMIGARRKWWTRDKFNRMAVVIDVERWGGQLSGDHGAAILAQREAIIRFLNGRRLPAWRRLLLKRDRKRVLIYGNAGDLAALMPGGVGDARVILAAYGSNPSHPAKVAHQFSDRFPVPPFGPVDINSADGMTPAQFGAAIGVAYPPAAAIKPSSVKAKPIKPAPAKPVHVVRAGETLGAIAAGWGVSLAAVKAANPHAGHPAGNFDRIMPGDRITHP